MKKVVIVSLMSVFLSAGTVFAAEEIKAEKPFTITLSSKWMSSYLGAAGSKFHGRVVQSELLLETPSGFYFGIWNSVGLNDSDWSGDYGDEMDYTIGWSGPVFDDFNLDVGITYWDCLDVGRMFDKSGEDVLYPYIELSKEIYNKNNHTFTPYIKVAVPYPAKTTAPERGVYIFSGLRHGWQINDKLSFSQDIGLVHDDGAFGMDSGFEGAYKLSLDYSLTESVTINCLTFQAYTPLTIHDERVTETAIGCGISITF